MIDEMLERRILAAIGSRGLAVATSPEPIVGLHYDERPANGADVEVWFADDGRIEILLADRDSWGDVREAVEDALGELEIDVRAFAAGQLNGLSSVRIGATS